MYVCGGEGLKACACCHLQALALALQNRISEVFQVDIHPGARIGRGVMLDHATMITIGETAIVEDDVSMLHRVSLCSNGTTCATSAWGTGGVGARTSSSSSAGGSGTGGGVGAGSSVPGDEDDEGQRQQRRHPHIKSGSLLGAGVVIMGPLVVGAGSKIGAGSVVFEDLPEGCVAVGRPAKVLRRGMNKELGAVLTPKLELMDQGYSFIYEI